MPTEEDVQKAIAILKKELESPQMVKAMQEIEEYLETEKRIQRVAVDIQEWEKKEAARALGSIKSPRKAVTARDNGRKGGRPKKSDN